MKKEKVSGKPKTEPKTDRKIEKPNRTETESLDFWKTEPNRKPKLTNRTEPKTEKSQTDLPLVNKSIQGHHK